MSAIEIVNEGLRDIDCGHRGQNGRQELVDVERHGDAALPGKQIHRRAYLVGNRADRLLVSFGNILIQPILLGGVFLLQAFALPLLRFRPLAGLAFPGGLRGGLASASASYRPKSHFLSAPISVNLWPFLLVAFSFSAKSV